MKSFKEYLEERQMSSSTVNTNVKILENLFFKWLEKENMEAENVVYNDLLLFMKHCARNGAKQITLQSYMVTVKHYYSYLQEMEKTENDPTTGIEIKGVQRKILYHILEANGLNRLYNKYNDESLKGRRNKVMLGLIVYQGLKTEELRKLEVKDIKLREGKVEVMGGRKSNERTLQLESHQVMDVYDYVLQVRPKIIEISKEETDKLLIGSGGGKQFSNFVTRLMEKLRKIDPSVKNAKQLRASVIMKWLKQYNLREVQYMAGHRYVSTTESYRQNEMEGLKEEIMQYHPLD